MTNAKGPMTKEFPNPKRQKLATLQAQRGYLEFRAWLFFGHLSLVICHSFLLAFASVRATADVSGSPDQTGKPVALQFQPLPATDKTTPPVLHLRGKDARQQLLVTAKFDSGPVRDYTRRVSYSVSPPDVVRIDKAGRITPLGDGTATVTAKEEDGLA